MLSPFMSQPPCHSQTPTIYTTKSHTANIIKPFNTKLFLLLCSFSPTPQSSSIIRRALLLRRYCHLIAVCPCHLTAVCPCSLSCFHTSEVSAHSDSRTSPTTNHLQRRAQSKAGSPQWVPPLTLRAITWKHDDAVDGELCAAPGQFHGIIRPALQHNCCCN